MKTRRILGAVLFAVLPALVGRVLAEDVSVTAKSFSAPTSLIRELDQPWLMLPTKQPINTHTPEFIPFNPARPLQGAFTPSQLSGLTSALAERKVELHDLFSRTLASETSIDLVAKGGKAPASVSVAALPDGKIKVAAVGTDASQPQEAIVAPGTTMVLSVAGSAEETAKVFLLTVSEVRK